MPKRKISPSKLARDTQAAKKREAKPTLAMVLSDISKLSENERGAEGGSALVKLDQAMRAVVAEHTKKCDSGMPMA
ncbi:MAG: hypothetical protein ACTSYK_02195, partial [Alphaproteobacteria bacterium]